MLTGILIVYGIASLVACPIVFACCAAAGRYDERCEREKDICLSGSDEEFRELQRRYR